MKKTIILFHIALLLFCFSSCAPASDTSTKTVESKAEQTVTNETLGESEPQTIPQTTPSETQDSLSSEHRFFKSAHYTTFLNNEENRIYHQKYKWCEECKTDIDLGSVKCKTNNSSCEGGCQ